MGEYHIEGGSRLSGQVKINGGKNAILPILASVVLNEGESIIHKCPLIHDTFITKEILTSIGCKVTLEQNTMIVDSSSANKFEVPGHLVREMRSSINFLGGLLGRFKKVKISYPGGCELGERKIDLHIKAMRELGATINDEHGIIIAEAKRLVGAKINLDFPSVGATENVMVAATCAEGQTTIFNAAKEPEIVDLQIFLNGMGADIRGAGTDTIVINGVKKLGRVEHTVIPDRIVSGTYLVAAAITGGDIHLTDVVAEHLYPITCRLEESGCEIKYHQKEMYLKAPKTVKPIMKLQTHPHPGFPTDMQSQLVAMLSLAKGTSVIIETIFESRNKHISELNRMGANIILARDGATCMIEGVKNLSGAVVEARDLRGGAALILAGLAAEGKTVVLNANHVERGYEKIEDVFSSLGAKIRYVK